MRSGSRPKRRATRFAALARDLGLPEGTNYSVADLFQKKYGMQAGNIVGTGIYKPDYISPAARHRPDRPT